MNPSSKGDRRKIFWESQRLVSQSVQADRPVPSNISTMPSTESEIKTNPNPNPQAPRNITTEKARGSSSEDFKPTNAGSRTRAGETRNKINQARPHSHVKFSIRNARIKKKRRPVSRRESSNPEFPTFADVLQAGQPAERIGGPNGSILDATLQGKLGARRRARARRQMPREVRPGFTLLDEREPLSVDVKRRS